MPRLQLLLLLQLSTTDSAASKAAIGTHEKVSKISTTDQNKRRKRVSKPGSDDEELILDSPCCPCWCLCCSCSFLDQEEVAVVEQLCMCVGVCVCVWFCVVVCVCVCLCG